MATRSRSDFGATAAPPSEHEEDDTTSRPQSAAPEDRMSMLESALTSFIQTQQDREERNEREAQRQSHRWDSLQHQFHQLQLLVSTEQQDRLSAGAVGPSQESASRSDPHPSTRHAVSRSVSPVSEGLLQVSSAPPVNYGWRPPKMAPYVEDEDIEHYLTTFERIAYANQ